MVSSIGLVYSIHDSTVAIQKMIEASQRMINEQLKISKVDLKIVREPL